MTPEDINARIIAIGRPVLANFADVLNRHAVAKVRAEQDTWDAAHPDELRERQHLVAELERMQAQAETSALNEAMRASDLERVRKQAGDRIADNLKAPREEPHLVTARRWMTGDEWSLSLIGRAGNGKTYAAAWVALNSGLRPSTWLHAPEAAARPLYGHEATQNADRASKAALLVIDDVGAELASAGWKSWLEMVLGNRYARRLKTIITSNLDAAAFAGRMEARLTDRLKEGCVFESDGKSLRPRGLRGAA
jgi:DNA replication protein DnaC